MASPPKRADSLSGVPGRPASPSPSRSFRNRMTTAVRRASTGLSFSQVGKLSRSSSKASLRVDPSHTSSGSEDAHGAPSPVAESPAREAAAIVDLPVLVGPSPLVNVTAAEEPVVDSSIPTPEIAPEVRSEPEPTTEATPEPTAVPASPELLPATLPPQASVPSIEPLGYSDPMLPTVAVRQEPDNVEPTPAEPPAMSVPEPAPPTFIPTPAAEPPVPSVQEERRPDYFSFGDPVEAPVKAPSSEPPAPAQPPVFSPPSPVEETFYAQPADLPGSSTLAWRDDAVAEPVQQSTELPQPEVPSGKVSTKASRSSISTSYGQLLPEQRRGRSSSVHFAMDNPFADQYGVPIETQGMEIPAPALSPVHSVEMPEAMTMPNPELDMGRLHESPAPLHFPLPPRQVVIEPQSAPHAATSAYVLGERDGSSIAETVRHDTDERIPLLHNAAPLGGVGKTGPSRGKTTHVIATFASGPITTELAAGRTLQALGWTEYALPDNTVYYHHEGLRVTTDVLLRDPRHLTRVTEYLEKTVNRETTLPPAEGWELWVKNAATVKPDFRLEQSWVNHSMRVVTSVPPPTISGNGLIMERFSEDDKLDMEYRYWCFIEGHPAHVSLPAETQAEAMDALKWSYTDCLLPTSRPTPPPFAPQECQELMNLLRSFDETTNSAVVVRSRMVARVLMRHAQWRQVYFRPNKPLPRDAIKGAKETRTPIARAFMDFIIGCLCLGIPYIFLSRTHHQSFDEESGLYSAGPMLMVSACACLVAAVILSASVTFLSLPQLDDVPRLAGFLAIAFSASSMVSAVIALFRYKTEIDRTIVYMGGEGLMVLSRRSIIFSLPLVFLAWAIAAFMTGITLYSFRGATVTSRMAIRQPFESYTHWAVVGTLGALGGMLTIATIVARR